MILKILKSIIPDAIPRIYYPNQSYNELKIKINGNQLKSYTNQLHNVFDIIYDDVNYRSINNIKKIDIHSTDNNNNSYNSTNNKINNLVVILGWAGSKPSNYKKLINFYLTHNQLNNHVILFCMPLWLPLYIREILELELIKLISNDMNDDKNDDVNDNMNDQSSYHTESYSEISNMIDMSGDINDVVMRSNSKSKVTTNVDNHNISDVHDFDLVSSCNKIIDNNSNICIRSNNSSSCRNEFKNDIHDDYHHKKIKMIAKKKKMLTSHIYSNNGSWIFGSINQMIDKYYPKLIFDKIIFDSAPYFQYNNHFDIIEYSKGYSSVIVSILLNKPLYYHNILSPIVTSILILFFSFTKLIHILEIDIFEKLFNYKLKLLPNSYIHELYVRDKMKLPGKVLFMYSKGDNLISYNIIQQFQNDLLHRKRKDNDNNDDINDFIDEYLFDENVPHTASFFKHPNQYIEKLNTYLLSDQHQS